MAQKVVTVRRNADQTYTVRVRRDDGKRGWWVEHVSTEGKEKAQVFDQIKYAVISKGINLTEVDLIEIMQDK